MSTEANRERLREQLRAAFADYQRGTSNAYDRSMIINTSAYRDTGEGMNCSGTRAKGTSKENCSPDIFQHLALLRVVKTLPPVLLMWVNYQYREFTPKSVENELVELTLCDLDLLSARRKTVDKYKALATTRIIHRRNFTRCMQKDLIAAIGVHRSVFARRYQHVSEKVESYFQTLDNQALDFILSAINES